jgi:hypothetical protein
MLSSPYLDYPQEVRIETPALCSAEGSFCPTRAAATSPIAWRRIEMLL